MLEAASPYPLADIPMLLQETPGGYGGVSHRRRVGLTWTVSPQSN